MMVNTLTIDLESPVESTQILQEGATDAKQPVAKASEPAAAADIKQTGLNQDLANQKELLAQLCATLQAIVDKLNTLYDEIFAGQKEEIARLSLEIARKILVQKVQDGDYQIESIVKEALENAPTRQDVVVHLNPQDMEQYQKAMETDESKALAGIKLVADSGLGRAECTVESTKGIVKSLINEQLEQVGKALEKAQ